MISRRRFVQLGTVAGAAMGASSLPRADAEQAHTPLPPSIDGLKSMKEQAKPTLDERRERQERARHLMESNRIDALLMMEGTSLDYFTGIHWWGGERLFAMVLPAKGGAFYVCPAFEEERHVNKSRPLPGVSRRTSAPGRKMTTHISV